MQGHQHITLALTLLPSPSLITQRPSKCQFDSQFDPLTYLPLFDGGNSPSSERRQYFLYYIYSNKSNSASRLISRITEFTLFICIIAVHAFACILPN